MRSWRSLRSGIWALGLAVVLVGLVAVLGGLDRAAPVQGAQVAPGEALELARFRVVVDRVELLDVDDYGYPADPTLQVWLQATATGDRTADGLPYGMVVVVADGAALPAGYARRVDGWESTLDPDLPRPICYVVDWSGSGPPADLRVVLFDERPTENFVDDATTGSVDASRPAAVVTVGVRDRRQGR